MEMGLKVEEKQEQQHMSKGTSYVVKSQIILYNEHPEYVGN